MTAAREADLALTWRRAQPELESVDTAVLANAWWKMAGHLEYLRDSAGAIGALRTCIAADGRPWITFAATMKLAQLLSDADDAEGARTAYEQARDLIPGLPPNEDLAGDPLSNLSYIEQQLRKLAADLSSHEPRDEQQT